MDSEGEEEGEQDMEENEQSDVEMSE